MRCSMDRFIDELTMASYESEMDLDRDMPGDEAFLEFNNMVDNDEEDVITGHFDVDVDENGPFITQSFDDYLDAHPDFNAALNGHPDWI
tara:strand:- start:2161 stop:2427 length:267 start_codon:yes stop_codon:yes gene_type:complete